MSGRIHRVVAELVIAGLRREAPELLDEAAARAVLGEGAGQSESVELAGYRELLRAAHRGDGGVALLRAGMGLRGLSHPLLFVLLNSDSPGQVLDKQARLARFLHSRHRVVLEASGPHSLRLVHVSSEAEAPELCESLAACGQYLALFEEIGCRALRCRFPASEDPRRWVYAQGSASPPVPSTGLSRWELEWAALEVSRRPMPGLDALLLADLRELEERRTVAGRVEAVVRGDLGRTWKLAEVAARLDQAPRSLQRSLAGEGERYSDLVDRIRNDEAARLLRGSALSITAVGYVCGFADAAHFSRSFKRRFGRPPRDYRRGEDLD